LTPEQEDRLRIAMSKLAVVENYNAARKWGGSTHAVAQTRSKFGTPPKQEAPRALSAQAKLINKLLLKGMTRSEIAELIEKPAGTVRIIIRRYSLPRNEA